MARFQLFFCTILISQVLPYKIFTKEESTENICNTNECKEAANHIQKWMNPAFKPCQDFYEFTCGYWHTPDNKELQKIHNSSIGEREDISMFYLKKLLLDEQPANGNDLYKTLKQFTSSCLDEDTINARGVSPALEIMNKVGGWPLLEKNWTGEGFNLVDAELALDGYLFPLKIESNDSNDDNLVLKIDQPNFFMSYIDIVYGGNDVMKKMVELAEAFGGIRSTIEAAIKDSMKLKYDIMKIFKGKKEPSKWYTLEELNKEFDLVDWTRLISGFFLDAPLPKNTSILVMKPKYIKELGELLESYPKSTIANMMMWDLAKNLAPYLTSNVSSSFVRTRRTRPTRLEYCTQTIGGSSLALVLLSYVAASTVKNTEAGVEMTKHLVDELLLDVQELDWLDDETRKSAAETIKSIKINIGFKEELLDVSEYYKDFKMDTSNYFEAAMDNKKWMKQKNIERFLSNNESPDWMNIIKLTKYSLSPLAYYHPRNQEIVVSGGFLHFIPLFNSELPAYINYGHLGSIISHELTHAIDTETDEKNRKVIVLRSWGNNGTKEIYDKKVKCVINQYSNFNDTKYTNLKLNGNRTEDEDIADIGGFKLALRAYKRTYANSSVPEPRLPLLQQYSIEQMFMISAANAYCKISDYTTNFFQMKYDVHSLNEFRVKGILINSPDFTKAFSCQPGDFMNPSNKCEVWQ